MGGTAYVGPTESSLRRDVDEIKTNVFRSRGFAGRRLGPPGSRPGRHGGPGGQPRLSPAPRREPTPSLSTPPALDVAGSLAPQRSPPGRTGSLEPGGAAGQPGSPFPTSPRRRSLRRSSHGTRATHSPVASSWRRDGHRAHAGQPGRHGFTIPSTLICRPSRLSSLPDRGQFRQRHRAITVPAVSTLTSQDGHDREVSRWPIGGSTVGTCTSPRPSDDRRQPRSAAGRFGQCGPPKLGAAGRWDHGDHPRSLPG